jgi:hypothetical protein
MRPKRAGREEKNQADISKWQQKERQFDEKLDQKSKQQMLLYYQM